VQIAGREKRGLRVRLDEGEDGEDADEEESGTHKKGQIRGSFQGWMPTTGFHVTDESSLLP